MRKSLTLFAITSLLAGCAAGPSPNGLQRIAGLHTPQPPYPHHAPGEGECYVAFNASGHVATVTMLHSTGSKILDNRTVAWARSRWSGTYNAAVNVPVAYLLVPKPPYPYAAKAHHVSGRGMYRVRFDAEGNATKIVVLRSTGSTILDENSVNFGLKNWHGPSNEWVQVPVFYQLRE